MLPTKIGMFTAALLLLAALPAARAGDDAAALSAWIDQQIDTRLAREGVSRVAPADDAEFLRRIYLDLHGVVPAANDAARFLSSSDPEKRARLIDELLDSPRFGEHMADLWRRRLVSSAGGQRFQPERFTERLAERFNRGDGWDQIVRDLVTATGKMDDEPTVIWLIEGRDPLGVTDLTDLTSRYFLGIQLNCAQCHDHPFVDWKQQDYWGMAAFFAQIQTPGRSKLVHLNGLYDYPQLTLASLAGSDELDGFLARPPTFLGGEEYRPARSTTGAGVFRGNKPSVVDDPPPRKTPDPLPPGGGSTPHAASGPSRQEGSTEEPLRRVLAEWMTAPDNPYFARAAANRLWWHFFGRGIVNPVDDMHAGNPPSHPELLEGLARRFADSGFDLKFLCRAIAGSRTYQQTSRPGAEPDREAELFARMSIKVLSAEQLYDSLVKIVGPPNRTPSINVRLGARHEFAQFFGSDADDPTRYERGIPQILRLMNSPQFGGRSLSGLVERAAAGSRSADEAAEGIFLAILARRPDEAERRLLREHVERAGSLDRACRELAWALVCSSEFSLNH